MGKVALAGIAAAAALALAACGGSGSGGSALSSGTPEQQIRALEVTSIADVLGDDPQSACKLTTRPADCVTGFAEAKAMGLKIQDMVPANWRNRVASATVTVSGDSATISPIVGSHPQHFVRQDGRWLIVQPKQGN
jgi:hypothetical protein